MQRRFLNVGGGDKETEIPSIYNGWNHVLLDIDPAVSPDICMDARELHTLNPGQFDAVYCSHNLEHYFAHDVNKVLVGFRHVLKDNGFAEIRVPDMGGLFKNIVSKDLDIDDLLYQSEDGPVLVRDVIYGFGPQIAQSGVDFYAHRTGFTRKSIRAAIAQAGFLFGVFTSGRYLEIAVRAFKQKPTSEQMQLMGIKAVS